MSGQDQQKYTNKLRGASVLIVGGSSGLGYAVAEGALEHGANVVISSSNQSRIDAAVERLQQSYPSKRDNVTGFACGLKDEATIEASIGELMAHATRNGAVKLDHVVITAGDALVAKPLAELSLPEMKQAGMVRFFAPMLIAKHAAPRMAAGPAASITLTTGSVSRKPIANWLVPGSYATGLPGLARQLALEIAPVRVNIVSPGAVDTEMWDTMMDKDTKAAVMAGMEKSALTGRVGRAGDVAEAYLYLMKDHNTTGEIVSTNSGALIS